MSEDSPLPKGLKPSPLVERLISGGAQPGEHVMIVGYIGRSPNDGYVRAYLDLTLSSYCEIDASDIVGTASIDPKNEISPSIVWVKRGAKIDRVDISRSTTVLGGQIQSNYLRRAMRNYAARARNSLLLVGGLTTAEDSCFLCASDLCPINTDECPTKNWGCLPSAACPTPPGSMFCPGTDLC